MKYGFRRIKELSRLRMVLSTNSLLDLLNYSYPTQPHSLIAKYKNANAHVKLLLKRHTRYRM